MPPVADDHNHPPLLFQFRPFRFRVAGLPPRAVPRRKKMSVVRLGSHSGWGWRGGRRIVAGFLRRIRLRWLVAKYRAMLTQLRECHRSLVRDLTEGAGSSEARHARIMMEAYFAAPLFPVSTVSRNLSY
ncbi:uncharacterized protein LOC122003924 [Zingiber officinale]|uniref:Uncharacterized protein n=1 Tax=Zingiber officinale TaxID=94328 RepID=A0A8J5FTJ4_ZINOF|nr:uncharacterized protein LOC122003924 [Zingiber officinale]KAG6490196.1 hypothetical protein ZIOFF_051481 [Zingiber officinale]